MTITFDGKPVAPTSFVELTTTTTLAPAAWSTAPPVFDSPWRFIRRRSRALGVEGYWFRRIKGGKSIIGPTVHADQ